MEIIKNTNNLKSGKIVEYRKRMVFVPGYAALCKGLSHGNAVLPYS